MARRFLVTAALPYSNGRLHVGHIAGAYLPADIYVRYLRATGADVRFICGSDDNGVAALKTAREEGRPVEELTAHYNASQRRSFEGLGIRFDVYGGTHQPDYVRIHEHFSQEFFRKIYEKGLFTKRTSRQLYDAAAQQFLPDRFVKGTCPHCRSENAFGDQCEGCGRTLEQTSLISPVSVMTGTKPELRETKHWYLRLDQLQAKLAAWLASKKDPAACGAHWRPVVINQSLGRIETEGLPERAMTRDLTWGVPVPLDDPDAAGKSLYVWFDAPIGYVSFTAALLAGVAPVSNRCDGAQVSNPCRSAPGSPVGTNESQLSAAFPPPHGRAQGEGLPAPSRATAAPSDLQPLVSGWWLDPDCKVVHFIGEDNIVFHAITWPAMMLATHDSQDAQGVKGEYQLPHNVVANCFLNIKFPGKEEEKISKSRGTAVWIEEYLQQFAPDPLRYYLTAIAPEAQRTAFEFEDFIARNNGELGNALGNFFNRCITFAHKYFEGKVPPAGPRDDADRAQLARCKEGTEKVAAELEACHFKSALGEVMSLARAGNLYFDQTKPFLSRKTDMPACARAINVCLQTARTLTTLMAPFLPESAERAARMLGLADHTSWASATEELGEGCSLSEAVVLFPRLEGEAKE
ncbi:MAG: methionine--tRNA ligase [Phycisphaerales bacterium]|nr:methionine--tRNA ligase [Phycisphaerales bacterium]